MLERHELEPLRSGRRLHRTPSGQVEALIAGAALLRRARRNTVRRVAVVLGTALFLAGAAWLAHGSRHQATAASLEGHHVDTSSSATNKDAGAPSASVAAQPVEVVTPGAAPGARTPGPDATSRTRRARTRGRSEPSAQELDGDRKTVRSGDGPATLRARRERAPVPEARAHDAAALGQPSERDTTDLRRVQKRERRPLDLDNPFQ